jgi:hypothetical protein
MAARVRAAQRFSAEVQFDACEDSISAPLKRDATAHVTDLYKAIPKRQCEKTNYDGTALGVLELDKLENAGEGRPIRTIMLLSEAQKSLCLHEAWDYEPMSICR